MTIPPLVVADDNVDDWRRVEVEVYVFFVLLHLYPDENDDVNMIVDDNGPNPQAAPRRAVHDIHH